MRNNLSVHISDIREIADFDESTVGINSHELRQFLVADSEVEKILADGISYEIEAQINDALGIEGNLYYQNGVLRFGLYRIVGDLLKDLKYSRVGLYSYELESGYIFTEREIF